MLVASSLAGAGVASDIPTPCSYRYSADKQLLPDDHCTPGAADPHITQDNIDTTICVSGYTKTVRPPVAVTNKLKAQSRQDYGWTGDMGAAEYDHLISLEIGGAPSDIANLWFEPGKIPNKKDAVEHQLHKLVCSHKVPLLAAQRAISTDWTTAVKTVSGMDFSGAPEKDDDDK